MQIIPIEEEKDIIQYIERLVGFFIIFINLTKLLVFKFFNKVFSEFTEDKNPFQISKDPFVSSKSSQSTILNMLKMIPKVGDKSARIILENFKSKCFKYNFIKSL